jgi:hypothetical protein
MSVASVVACRIRDSDFNFVSEPVVEPIHSILLFQSGDVKCTTGSFLDISAGQDCALQIPSGLSSCAGRDAPLNDLCVRLMPG